jgi:hypothetical protein
MTHPKMKIDLKNRIGLIDIGAGALIFFGSRKEKIDHKALIFLFSAFRIPNSYPAVIWLRPSGNNHARIA